MGQRIRCMTDSDVVQQGQQDRGRFPMMPAWESKMGGRKVGAVTLNLQGTGGGIEVY